MSTGLGVGGRKIELVSSDGTRLEGRAFRPAEGKIASAILLVHKEGEDERGSGLFDFLIPELLDKGMLAVTFNIRGHGTSEGEQEELTISSIANDMRAAVCWAWQESRGRGVTVIAAGISACASLWLAAVEPPPELERILMFQPVLDPRRKFIDRIPYWRNRQIDQIAGRNLSEHSFLPHSSGFRLGRPFLNEILNLDPASLLSRATVSIRCMCEAGGSKLSIHGSHADIEEEEEDALFSDEREVASLLRLALSSEW
ncbi:alpha/beta hydrolase family protein [Actinoplanes awajinensis]|uniref:alpha/beta hydrolase family protein n=1 Tax=Actinoplanes awajinensis TaxID=135946 RepID=UPI000AF64B15|nr:CocE/NonD family hydrolase [Actinoplanes awajinensis]